MNSKESLTRNTSELFAYKTRSQYINFFDLFVLYFQIIPNSILEETIDAKKHSNFQIN